MKKMYNAQKIEKKWQDKWEESKIFEADPDISKRKIFFTSPYPYASGTLHIGHGRSFVNGDIFARYYRAKGYNVLYPMAFHITGTPVLAVSSSIKRNDAKITTRMKEYVSLHTKSKKEVEKIVESFKDPWNIVSYFSNTMKKDFKSIGMSIDWRREFTTGDKLYNKFIEWQYYKFHEKGYLEKGDYPILYCPRCKNAVGEDDIASGDELNLEISEYVYIKFPFNDSYLVPATLRPETIYGVTNIWLNPNGIYVYARVNGEKWIISEEAISLLKNQNKSVIILEKVKGSDLIGRKVKSVYVDKDIPILPAEFVDTSVATGVVYSVPAHAPYDYIALEDLKNNKAMMKKFNLNEQEINNIEPIQIIDLEEVQDIPARFYCNKYNVSSQNNFEKLDKATTDNYKIEFYNGILNDKCNNYKGVPVNKAVIQVIENLISNDKADKLFIPITRDLRCRCGEKVIITILKDQWFLNFNAGNWKQNAFKCLNEMTIVPNKYRLNFENVFNWLEKRPCARKRGLGTKLPFDKDWIIESLSDSTIYMSFYTISHHLKHNNIKPEQLVPEFFDFTYLKKGNIQYISKLTKINEKLLQEMQDEFHYWYPVDHRHTAIMHISNHLSFYIFHHVAIFPEQYWPKIITLIEPVIIEGQKMGKSKGNIISLADIQNEYSADLFRFYISHSADLGINMDWREKEIQAVKNHINRFYRFMFENIQEIQDSDVNDKLINSKYAEIILSKIIQNFVKSDMALKEFNLKRYLQLSFYETFNLIQDLKKYTEAEENFKLVFKLIYKDWLKLLSLAIPHLCEELWEVSGNQGFISKSSWEEFNLNFIKNELEIEYDYVSTLINDILSVKKIIKAQKLEETYIYTAPHWKYEVFEVILSKKGDFKSIIKELKKRPDIMRNEELIPFVKSQTKNRIWERFILDLNELELLNQYKGHIEKKVNSKIIINSDFDPQNKSGKAIPFKPAIYIEVN
ncbi:MAG: leucine--tRNA ligase [Promethearchaeota archaeon]